MCVFWLIIRNLRQTAGNGVKQCHACLHLYHPLNNSMLSYNHRNSRIVVAWLRFLNSMNRSLIRLLMQLLTEPVCECFTSCRRTEWTESCNATHGVVGGLSLQCHVLASAPPIQTRYLEHFLVSRISPVRRFNLALVWWHLRLVAFRLLSHKGTCFLPYQRSWYPPTLPT